MTETEKNSQDLQQAEVTSSLIKPVNYKLHIIGLAAISALTAYGQMSFLFFHVLAEIFSVVVAFAIFIVSWNSRSIHKNDFMILLGLTYLFVGFIDFLHTMAYKGMNIFPAFDADLPTQLWIASRYLEGFALVAAPIFFRKRLNPKLCIFILSGYTALVILTTFFWPVFPECYSETSGLTSFKIISEMVICLIFALAIGLLFRYRKNLHDSVFYLLVTAVVLKILAEFAFVFYVGVYDLSNIIGHSLKFFSFYLIYRALVVAALADPYNNMFRELLQSRNEKEKIIGQLKESLEKVKLLEGFLPICSSCKKIRDDKGCWNQMEQYISAHSEAKFSHGICPVCAKKLYPEFSSDKQ